METAWILFFAFDLASWADFTIVFMCLKGSRIGSIHIGSGHNPKSLSGGEKIFCVKSSEIQTPKIYYYHIWIPVIIEGLMKIFILDKMANFAKKSRFNEKLYISAWKFCVDAIGPAVLEKYSSPALKHRFENNKF